MKKVSWSDPTGNEEENDYPVVKPLLGIAGFLAIATVLGCLFSRVTSSLPQ